MTDDLDHLAKALKADTALPDERSRAAAISAAMDAFEKENFSRAQGMGLGTRLMDQGRALYKRIAKERSMKLTHILAGGASLAVLSIAVLNTSTFTERYGNPPKPVEAPVEANEADRDRVKAKVNDLTDRAEGRKKEVARADAEEKRQAPQLAESEAPQADPAPQPKIANDQLAGIVAAPPAMPAPEAGARRLRKQVTRNFSAPAIALNSTSIGAGQADMPAPRAEPQGRDKFSNVETNPLKLVSEDPVSTFSIDVDTASYSFMRASLNNNRLPQKNAVRVEELINYFPYDYAPPQDKSRPFATHVSVMPSPWNTQTRLIHIGIKGYELPKSDRPRSNLVFLLDTSGSMNQPNKLPLLINSFKLLLTSLQPEDTISIVAYAGSAGTVLEPTKVTDKNKILAALDRLRAGGSTAGGEGVRLAYQLAEQTFDKDGINRVILATDGDFNVGIRDPEELKSFVERKRKTGVTLSVLGFGTGNYNDALMQTLAQNGNGNAAYIDSLSEARKVLVEQAGSTLFTIAKDVKIQMEFNPATVSEYRLIGYETRILKREDFNNDKVDAGDIGPGHSVTAIYEITPKGSSAKLVDDLRYAKPEKAEDTKVDHAGEYGFLKLRYKLPDGDKSTLITTPVTRDLELPSLDKAGTDARFATAVAAFGQLLRGGRYTGTYKYEDVVKLAQSAKGDDEFGYRAEFINLVRLAKSAAALAPQAQ